MSTFSSANITDGNLVLKERTHRIKIKYSMHQYSIRLHNLGNWLIALHQKAAGSTLQMTMSAIIAVTSRIPRFTLSAGKTPHDKYFLDD